MRKDQRFSIDSHRLLEWINQITCIHNSAVKGEDFATGFNLCFLQQCMVECLKDLERREKEDRD